jgi:hypothetical protein
MKLYRHGKDMHAYKIIYTENGELSTWILVIHNHGFVGETQLGI